ncbi:MAG TPA: PqqD family protein [Solirubrobacterales bacterium]|nr:PqqD family protein [Solirubrobacterales bacterium]
MPASGTTENPLLERAETVIDGRLPEETVLLRTDTGDSVRLNATGAWLWSQLESPLELEELGRRLAAAYGIPGERARADAGSFARELEQRGFLALGEPG